jgi:hypothetical protein
MSAAFERAGPGRRPDEWHITLAEEAGVPARERLSALHARLYRAVDAVLDGHLAQTDPDSAGKSVVVTVETRGTPPVELERLVHGFSAELQRIPRYRDAIADGHFATGFVFELNAAPSRLARMAYLPVDGIRTVVSFAHHYERHLSVLAMIGGYAFDSYAFGRIDHAATHAVFVGYLAVAGIAIAISHRLESRPPERQPSQRIRTILTAITQFALGCLLSGFCVFYLRSASLWASWPYLLLLAAVFVGNEFFKKYTTRFTLSVLLYFFAILSYAILVVPVLLSMIGVLPFVVASVAALTTFIFYGYILDKLAPERFDKVRWPILGGVVLIAAAVNAFYFLKVLPPLPLALADAGVYHMVTKTGTVVTAEEEVQPWTVTYFGQPAVQHVAPADRLYVYAAIFAPAGINTPVVYRWEWFDPQTRKWAPQGPGRMIRIRGGRDGGYRASSNRTGLKEGAWRVNITTQDGRQLGRIRFAVVAGAPSQPLQSRVLN